MSDLMQLLPLLNLLVLPVFAAYVRQEVRLTKLEAHQHRVEIALGFNERGDMHHGK